MQNEILPQLYYSFCFCTQENFLEYVYKYDDITCINLKYLFSHQQNLCVFVPLLEGAMKPNIVLTLQEIVFVFTPNHFIHDSDTKSSNFMA